MTKRILIAEDDYSSREALTRLAVQEGYDVMAVADGVQLLSIVDIGKFDVVITDLMMPDLNGASASDIMKLKGDMTPVIAVTGPAKMSAMLEINLTEFTISRLI